MSESVLVVDDEEGIRNVLSISLADAGYEVHTAENGIAALEKFKEIRPGTVLTDIKMPGMDGIELLRRIKEEGADTEVVMITGHSDLDLAIKSLKLEATDFITKPIQPDSLDVALNRARERIFMREQLRQYTDNLEQLVLEKTQKHMAAERLAAIGETVAGISRSIKNVARGLESGGVILEKGIASDNKKYLFEGWDMVKGNVAKIEKLSLDLLSYAKTTQIQPEMCDPNEPAQEVFQLMQPRAEKYGVCLNVDINSQLTPIFLDSEGICRCLLNLVTNAIDACQEDVSCGKQKEVLLKTARAEGWGVEYQVIDNCCGMDEEVLKNIFGSFFTTKGAKGTGIGLMLTKKIVEEHNGIINAESKKGAGSKFVIKLPGPSTLQ